MDLTLEANRTLQRILKNLDLRGLSAAEKKQISDRLGGSLCPSIWLAV